MNKLNSAEKTILQSVALKLGVKTDSLYGLINFESNWNPMAQNAKSSAKGLIQIIDVNAQKLGYKNSWDMIQKNPTIQQQLTNCVYPYLKSYMPFKTEQALFMSVFYPKAMYWPETKQFPDSVVAANSGIRTPLDYIKKVYLKMSMTYVPTFIILLLAGTTALLILSKKL